MIVSMCDCQSVNELCPQGILRALVGSSRMAWVQRNGYDFVAAGELDMSVQAWICWVCAHTSEPSEPSMDHLEDVHGVTHAVTYGLDGGRHFPKRSIPRRRW